MPLSSLWIGLIALAIVLASWVVALAKRAKATGDEEVLLDIATPPLSDWVVLGVLLAAAIALAFMGLSSWPGLLVPLALALTGALMFVDNLPAAITARGLRRGLSIEPWTEFAGWHWDPQEPHTLVLDGDAGEQRLGKVAIPVTEPAKAANAPETPDHPSPDDYPDWDSFREVIESSLTPHLPQTDITVPADAAAAAAPAPPAD